MLERAKKSHSGLIFVLTTIIIAISAMFLGIRCFLSENIYFVRNSPGAAWITYPKVIGLNSQPSNAQGTVFKKTFFVSDENLKNNIYLDVMALRTFSVSINGLPIKTDYLKADNWKKKTRIDITNLVRPEANLIEVEVTNTLGPPLLWSHIRGLRRPVKTDPSWFVRTAEIPERNAVLADDTLPYKVTGDNYSPYKHFLSKKMVFVGVFVLAGLLFFCGIHIVPERHAKQLSRLILLVVPLVWCLIFYFKSITLHPFVGFDAPEHIEYIFYILAHNKLPTASEGWVMYHPPFFYLLSAFIASTLKNFHDVTVQILAIKLIPFACGLGNVFITYMIGKKVFQDRPKHILFATFFAGILPMNIYLSAYIGNEPLHTFLVSSSIFFVIDILTDSTVRYAKIVCLGILMGLASMTKTTVLALYPCTFLFIFVKMLFIDKTRLRESAAKILVLFSIIMLVSGWYYARNFALFGRFMVINQDTIANRWWQYPGFHTPKYYLGFGEVFKFPLYSGLHSFWDSIYSTFWGDAYIAGYTGSLSLANLRKEVPWNYEYMLTVYLLAIPATFVFFIGLSKMIKDMFSGTVEVHYRTTILYLASCLYSVWFFVLYYSLKLPAYSAVKAFYGLCVIVPISIIFALGFVSLDNLFMKLPRAAANYARSIFVGWFGMFVFAIVMSYLS